ncbi:polymer-forming cytoskeletal protein [Planctomycetota bacterium]|nr:polymer-forming cytoskeletal protein [Planctomycetota bacterium]
MSEAMKNKTVLGPDCRISGELSLDNDAVIMGQFKGTLRVSGTLELTDSAEVAGTIIVGHLRLAGRAEADVIAENGLELLPGAQLIGQVYTSNLNVVEGAVFQGDVCIGPKAMEAAGEVLAQHNIAAPAPAATEDYTEEQYIDEPIAEEAVDASEVKTVPGSVNAILQRRRAKVLSTRG